MTTTKQYDFLNRLLSISSVGSTGASPVAVDASSTVSFTYAYNDANQRTRVNLADGSFWIYAYDAAGNLSNRVQNVQTNVFKVDSLNQLTSVVRTNTSATVAGATTIAATSITVADNGNSPVTAIRYADRTFTRTNVTLLNGNNTFVAVAQDSLGRLDTNTVTVTLPTGVSFLYDQNGNMRTNGTRAFEYDDENQLTRITEPSAWKAEFTYDGKLRRRIERNYRWTGSAWQQTNEVRFVYDGNLVIQDRNEFNLPTLTLTRGLDLSGGLQGAGGIGGLLALTDHSTLNSQPSTAHSYYQPTATET